MNDEFPEPYIEKSATMADWLQAFSVLLAFGSVIAAFHLLVWVAP